MLGRVGSLCFLICKMKLQVAPPPSHSGEELLGGGASQGTVLSVKVRKGQLVTQGLSLGKERPITLSL